MKKSVLVFCLFLIFGHALHAAILSVSADPAYPAQYTTLQAAHDAASTGDTIHCYGNASFGNASLTKQLVILGTSATFPANQAAVVNLDSGSSGCIFLGGVYQQIVFTATSNVVLRDSWVHGFYRSGSDIEVNMLCIHCLISFLSLDAPGSRNYQNCIFDFGNWTPSSFTSFSISATAATDLFDHCIFLRQSRITASSGVATFSNCIFIEDFYSGTCFGAQASFDHNLFVGFTPDAAAFCGPQINTENNFMNVENPFVNGTLVSLSAANFQLVDSSPGNDAASDGTDIGLHGGTQAWPVNYHYGLNLPGIPVVSTLTLENYIIGISDQLEINAQGSIPSNE